MTNKVMRITYDNIPAWNLNEYEIEGILEYVGARGVIASRFVHARMKTPKPGDWVDLRTYKEYKRGLGIGGYDKDPYYILCHDFGRIASRNWLDEGDVHICVGAASCYFGPVFEESRCYVSISGGPFERHKQSELIPTGELKLASFWNFKNDEWKAHNGQTFHIMRPVFELRKSNEQNLP